jgi:hypothetical protein
MMSKPHHIVKLLLSLQNALLPTHLMHISTALGSALGTVLLQQEVMHRCMRITAQISF